MGPFGSADTNSAEVTPPPPAGVVEIRLFEHAFPPPYRFWRFFLASAVLHAVSIALLPALLSLLPEDENAAWKRRAFQIRPLELQIDDRLYLPASAPAGGKEGGKPRPEGPRPAKEKGAKGKLEAPAAKPAPRRFELPALARRADSDQTILQPQYPPNLALEKQVRLPNVVFWSAQARLPKPSPKRFIQPGREASTPPSMPSLDAPPRLDLPNQELNTASLNISGTPFSERPKLPMPRGATMPVRVFRPPTPASQSGASVDAIIGEPVNLIALSSNPSGPARVLVVPPGNQLGRLPGPPGEGESGEGDRGSVSGTGSGGTGTGKGDAAGTGSGSGVAGTGSGGQGSGSGRGTGAGTGSGGHGGTGSGSGSGSASGAGSGARAGGSGTGGNGAGGQGVGSGQLYAMGGAPSGMPSSVAMRIAEPNTSVADIVVQSSESGVLPEAARVLSGQPVYSVYLNLATRKEWILQYCKPRSTDHSTRVGANVVTLGADAPVKAPYLIVRATPPITLEPRETYILIHGMLDVTGRFRDLSMVEDSDAQFKDQILPYLQQWEFRPGTQDGRPVLLEILVVIPPNRG